MATGEQVDIVLDENFAIKIEDVFMADMFGAVLEEEDK